MLIKEYFYIISLIYIQILTDIFNRKVIVQNHADASAMAALVFKTLACLSDFVLFKVVDRYFPESDGEERPI